MLKPGPDLLSSEPEVALVGKLIVIENACLATAVAIVAAEMAQRYLHGARLVRMPISGTAALIVLLTALSLFFSRGKSSRPAHWLSSALALLVTLDCGAAVVAHLLPSHPGINPGMDSRLVSRHPYPFPPLTGISLTAATALALLGLAIALVRMRRGALRHAADFLAFCSALAVLMLCSGHIIATLPVFEQPARPATAAGTVVCLLALTVAMLIRRAQYGFFSVLLGSGIGSRMARLLAPILLIAPYLHELVRARLIEWRHMPQHYITAVLASTVAAITMCILLYLAWRLNLQETEIHALSLRDPLTGLYNLRGFWLLADQMLLMARRSGQPFSLVFLDVDNLKRANDTLGHQAGSQLLVKMADILRDTFREADVLGRIGGDEFAVAGQLGAEAARNAAKRLQQAASERNAQCGNSSPGSSRASSRGPASELSFSAGFVTSEPGEQTPLADLLARADEEMYREKGRKKALSSPAEHAQGAPAGRPAQKVRKRREPEEGPPNLFA